MEEEKPEDTTGQQKPTAETPSSTEEEGGSPSLEEEILPDEIDLSEEEIPFSEENVAKNTPVTEEVIQETEETPKPSPETTEREEHTEEKAAKNTPITEEVVQETEEKHEETPQPSTKKTEMIVPTEEETTFSEEKVATNPPITEEVIQKTEETPLPLPEKTKVEKSAEEETHIDFTFLETESRWLLKVIAGPNTGAEFALHGGTTYVIGSDPNQCDVIFHDMSISRKHAKITIDSKENAVIEDTESKNGTFIEGKKISSYPIKGNVMVTLGTTTFVLIDRTQEQKTIYAPKTVPQIATPEEGAQKPAPQEQKPAPLEQIRQAAIAPIQSEVEKIKEETEEKKNQMSKTMSSLTILSIITVILLFLGVGTTFLFRTETIKAPTIVNPEESISKTLQPYPAIRYSYNPTNQHLLLVGHVLTEEERSRMLDAIQQLPFLKDISFDNVVIDDYVWREINQIIAKNPQWKGITVTSPKAGTFVLSGILKKRANAEDLLEYLTQNFPYMNLLEQKIIIEEDLLTQVDREFMNVGCPGVKSTLTNGELILTGSIASDKKEAFSKVFEQLKKIAGIRGVQSQVTESGGGHSFVDLTGRYKVTGYSKQGDSVSVVINGRILSRGDSLDGMIIIDVTPSSIFLERNNVTYKIDYIK